MDFYDIICSKIPNEIPEFWHLQVKRYVTSAGLSLEYSQKELGDVLEWLINAWSLDLEDINWVYIRERGGNVAVIKELQNLANSILESGLYNIEKRFGYTVNYDQRPKTKGEALGQQLFELFRRDEDAFFARMGEDLRASEFAKSKAVVRRMNDDIQKWIKIQMTKYMR